MNRSRSIASASSVLFLALALLAADAAAAKRIVVLDFSGRGARDAQDEVEELVEREGTLIGEATFRRAQRRLRVRRLDDSGMARIAAELDADAFVDGVVERRRRGRYQLELTIREGLTGAITDKLTIPMRSRRFDRRARDALAAEIIPALAKITDLGTPEEPIDITPVDDEMAPLGGVPPATDPAAPLAEDEGPPPPTEELGYEDEARPPADEMVRWRHTRHAAVDVQLGASAVRRTLSFTYRNDLTAGQRPNGYSGGIVPSILLTGEIYPMAFSGKPGPLSGIGIGFVVDRVLLLKSRYTISGTTREYDTSQMKLGGGLRYRWNFGHKATLPTVKLIAGFQMLDFTIERGADDIDLPNVSYTYLDLGAAVRLPLGTPTAALYLDARYLHVLGAGEIQDPMFYGEGGVLGFDGDVGFELIFLRRAILRAGARYQRLAYDFDGTGARTERDGNTDQDVGGALDQYLQGYVTFGYLF